MNSLLYSNSQVSLVPTVCPSNREIYRHLQGSLGGEASLRLSIAGGRARYPGGMAVINRDGREIHRKRSEVAAAVTHNSDSDSQ